jgi:signal transduction histidine kinase
MTSMSALEREGGEVVLALRDDGRGFDAEAAWEDTVRGGSMGLLIMRERAMLAGGRLRIRSEPGGGTEVEARFPVENEP